MCSKRLFLPVGILLLPVLAIACGGADSDSSEAEDTAPAETMEAATLTPAVGAAESRPSRLPGRSRTWSMSTPS